MKNISAADLKAKMNAGEKINLIDVREPNEFAESNIPGAILVPLSKIQMMDIDPIEDMKEEEIFVHCRSGKRSVTACQFLEGMGFTNLTNVEGGILAWKE
ncbi:MAG: rhodanese-like domain-containing protein [Gemmatimonadaceae bacterium]|nr:rhodanese-like domain-containing protein [Chitinophagaceae bacterium]